ncbi:MAG TPA: ATP-binding cassette domain-containing protein [Acidimicrobiales bacterium]
MSGPPVLVVDEVSKSYRRAAEEVAALRKVSFLLEPGEMVAVVGPSGSGKTTLLNLVCGWERPDDGELRWGDGFPGDDPADFGWAHLAIVPQALGLAEDLSVRENVALPGRLARGHPSVPVDDLLFAFGLDQLAARQPKETSLGEQQRAAVARALALEPRLLLADEPSAHQNAAWAEAILDAFRRAADGGAACLIATHDPHALPRMDRVLTLRDGELV